jgi:monoamine oxidase
VLLPILEAGLRDNIKLQSKVSKIQVDLPAVERGEMGGVRVTVERPRVGRLAGEEAQGEGWCHGGWEFAEEIEADFVVVTLPLGVLKSKSVEFVPPLPREKAEAIEMMGMGTENKVILMFF